MRRHCFGVRPCPDPAFAHWGTLTIYDEGSFRITLNCHPDNGWDHSTLVADAYGRCVGDEWILDIPQPGFMANLTLLHDAVYNGIL